MNKKMMATTGLFAAISVAGAMGLLMSGKTSTPQRMAKKVTCTMEQMGNRMGDMWHSMKK